MRSSNHPIQEQSRLELMTSIITSMMIVPFRIIRIDLTISHFAFKISSIKIIGHIHNFTNNFVKCEIYIYFFQFLNKLLRDFLHF